MRVAYFTESLPPIADGVARTLSNLVPTLEDEGVDFRFYNPLRSSEDVGDGSAWSRGPNRAAAGRFRKVWSVPLPVYSYYRLGVPLFQGLRRELDEYAPDLVHVVTPSPLGLFAMRHARRRGVPLVTSYHTHFVRYAPYYGLAGWERFGWALLRAFHNRCARTYAPSPSAARELQRHGIQRVEIWSRGIDLARFSPRWRSASLRAALGAREGCVLLLYVGRLVKEKNLDHLAAVAEALRDRGVPQRLVLVGDGPMRRELEARLPEAHFAGFRTGDELSCYYASCDLFVFPSTTETFGNVVLEAFASGLPAVGVDAGGIADLIASGENGALVGAGDARALAGTLECLIAERPLRERLAAGARATARGRTWAAANGALLASYRRLLDGRRGAVPAGRNALSGPITDAA